MSSEKVKLEMFFDSTWPHRNRVQRRVLLGGEFKRLANNQPLAVRLPKGRVYSKKRSLVELDRLT